VNWEVEPREFTESGMCGIVIGARGLFFGCKQTEMKLLAIHDNSCAPSLTLLVECHTLERRRAATRFRIRAVLGISTDTKIAAPII
jgi:hypothetical protein